MTIAKINRSWIDALLALLFSCGALYLRIVELAGRELWNDEIYQLSQSVGPLKPVLKRLTYGDMTCFPGDYLLTFPFVQIFGDYKWGLAIPHIAATIFGLYVLYLIGRRYFKTWVGFVVAFAVVGLHEDLIFHAFEFRPYAVLPTLALASFYFADRLFNDDVSAVKKFWIGVFYVATLWFHAFGILIAAFPLLFFLLVKTGQGEGRAVKGVMLRFYLPVFVIALPLWLWYATGNPMHQTPASRLANGMHPFQHIQNPFEYGLGSFFNRIVFYNLIGFKRLYFLLGSWVLLIVVPFDEKLKKLGFFLTVIFLPLYFIFTAALVSNYWFLGRQYLYLAPLFAFFLGWLWDSSFHYYIDFFKNLAQRSWSIRIAAGLVIMTGCSVGGMIGLIKSLF